VLESREDFDEFEDEKRRKRLSFLFDFFSVNWEVYTKNLIFY
jgi:hypothetical protein